MKRLKINKGKGNAVKTGIIAFLMVAAVMILPAAAATESIDFAQKTGCVANAMSTAFNCEVYNTSPTSMTLTVGKSKSITKVYKYNFKIKSYKTFSSLENVIKGVNGKSYKTSSFTWISENKSVAEVNSSGKVTAVGKGTTYIYSIPKSISSYSIKGKYALFTDIDLQQGLKASGAFGMKVVVK